MTEPFKAKVSWDLEAFGAMTRASYEFKRGGFFLKPKANLGFTYLDGQNVREEGAGATNLRLLGNDENHLWVRPALEIGDTVNVKDNLAVRLYADISYQYYLTGKDTNVRAGFTGASRAAAPMEDPIMLGSLLS